GSNDCAYCFSGDLMVDMLDNAYGISGFSASRTGGFTNTAAWNEVATLAANNNSSYYWTNSSLGFGSVGKSPDSNYCFMVSNHPKYLHLVSAAMFPFHEQIYSNCNPRVDLATNKAWFMPTHIMPKD